MKRLPLGIQNFREIKEGNYVYADKTEYIYNLIYQAKYNFLSRPRRFGKSLLLDTIHQVFRGDKELFKGLWIYESDYEFKAHPVVRIDMSKISSKTPDVLEENLLYHISNYMAKEGFEIKTNIPSALFATLIELLYEKYQERVVVLIDEYDKPILDHLTDIDIAEANRMVIKGFYGILKSMDPYLEFTMITGVSKFTKTSVFSELNNLLDLTLTADYANICGITIEEFESCFKEHMEQLSQNKNMTGITNLRDEIIKWYDGYSWDGETRVINPFSLLSFFTQKRFSGFWFASGTPKFLMDLLKEKPQSYLNVQNLELSEWVLDSVDIRNLQAGALLFQTGYLTIKEKRYYGVSESYLLGMPNQEVKEAFNLNILSEFTEAGQENVQSSYRAIKEALEDGDLERMTGVLRGLFASIPYFLHINMEAYYHSIFYAIMNLFGFEFDAEVLVSGGRVDGILELEDKVYVFEFKYKKCDEGETEAKKELLFQSALDEGMKQIKEKGYDKKYSGSGKCVYLVAMAFLGRDQIEMRVE